jgi:hypothetical protein
MPWQELTVIDQREECVKLAMAHLARGVSNHFCTESSLCSGITVKF